MIKKSWHINSDYNNVKIISSEILQILDSLNIDEKERFEIRFCIEESLVNAIRHGNKSRIDLKIKVDFEIDEKQFKISIEDEGEGFDYENIPDPTSPENLTKIGGRGLFVTRNFMDKVYFNRKGNRITMVKKLKRGEEK